MVGACNRLGVDVMTGHWEFTYLDREVIENIGAFEGEFVAQNVTVREDAQFDYKFEDFAGYDADAVPALRTVRVCGPSSSQTPAPPVTSCHSS